MKWFQHDTDALYDAKIKKLIFRHGAIGYAVYFHCIELIAGTITKNNINFELEHDAEIIADNLKIQGDQQESAIDKVNRIMKDIINLGLFECIDNRIFCYKLASRLDNTVSRSPQINEIKKITTETLRSCNVPDKIREDKIKSDKIIKKVYQETPITPEQSANKIILRLNEAYKTITIHPPFKLLNQVREHHLSIIKEIGETKILEAIELYKQVLADPDCLYTYKYTLLKFLENIDQWLPENKPLDNFRKKPYTNTKDSTFLGDDWKAKHKKEVEEQKKRDAALRGRSPPEEES